MNNYVKNQAIWTIFGIQKPEEIKWYLACPPHLKDRCYQISTVSLKKLDASYIHTYTYICICIANCYITRQLQLKFHKSKTGETVRSVHHICAPNIVKLTDFWLKYSRKGGCFYWETVYIHGMTIFQLLAFQNQQPVPLLVGWLVLCASWTQTMSCI